jgi:excisionase family DNA binding protein
MSELLTIKEAGERLRVSPRTVQRLIADRQIKVVKIRRSSFVTLDELERYVKARQRLA